MLYGLTGLLPMLLLVLNVSYVLLVPLLIKPQGEKTRVGNENLLAAYPVYVKKMTIKPEATAASTPNVNDLSKLSHLTQRSFREHTEMRSFCFEPLIRPEYVCDQ